MAQYTVEAFPWLGWTEVQHNTSHEVVFDDNDAAHDGRFDADESVSIDGGPFQPTCGDPWVFEFAFTDVNGDSHVEKFNFFSAGDATSGVVGYFVPGVDSAFTVGATQGAYVSHAVGWNYADIICLTRGTLIGVRDGQTLLEDLRIGDLIRLADGSFAPLRLALSRQVPGPELRRSPKLRPVRIVAGALGGGLPRRDLLVSRQHRMVIRSRIARRMFGQDEVLVSAIRLCALPGVFVDQSVSEVEYFHLVLDRHEVILAEEAPTESLYFGKSAIASLAPAARAEIETLFGSSITTGKQMRAARLIPPMPRQNQLIRRHVKNRQELICSY